jgi:CDP-diacylglycerol---serine O-phosphatidyltransferase
MKSHFPNLLTLCNLFCGCCALVFLFHGDPRGAAWFTLGSFLCDYADGMVARALDVQSPIGRELDSLADVVSFGVVPSTMLYHLLKMSNCAPGGIFSGLPYFSICISALPAFVLAAFAAYRLAKFNVDTRQKAYFLGLSTPACTLFVMGITLTATNDLFGLRDSIQSPVLLYVLIPLLSGLMVGEIPMFGLKTKDFSLKNNRLNLLFLVMFGLLVFLLKELALTAVIVLYIAVSILFKSRVIAPN